MKNELTSAQTMIELAKQTGEEVLTEKEVQDLFNEAGDYFIDIEADGQFKPLTCDYSILGTFNIIGPDKAGFDRPDLINHRGELFDPEIHVSSREVEFVESRPIVLTDCSLLSEGFEPVTETLVDRTKSQVSLVQQWGRMFRGRWPEEINPKPQPDYFELCKQYGEVWDSHYSMFDVLHKDHKIWIEWALAGDCKS